MKTTILGSCSTTKELPACEERLSLPLDTVVRNELKFDLFQSDLPEIVSNIERHYHEIKRPTLMTLTLYFYDAVRGAPDVDLFFRLRTYADIDPNTTTLADLKELQWRAEMKNGHMKTQLGTVPGLFGDDGWDLFGTKRRPRQLKISQRRHFALGEASDESQRITLDQSCSMFIIEGDRLERLGDEGPRVELKFPQGKYLDAECLKKPCVRMLRAANHYMPFNTMASYSQFLLLRLLPFETHAPFCEIEAKYAITSDSPGPDKVFEELFAFVCGRQSEWRLLIPYPHVITRTRRFHVCKGDGTGRTETTLVETASGRCSLKIKDDARSIGPVLLRTTQASLTTDIDGKMMTPEEFLQTNGLTKINQFTKVQRQIPIALANGNGYLFTLDLCSDPLQHSLAQLEIAYIGSTDGQMPPMDQVLHETNLVGSATLASPLGAFLESTQVTKHAFFAKAVGRRVM